ncbi:MAG TPA: hypothetical protein VFX43_06910 [Chitinophagaceae bacterium]|nr:hypothetical protein [Chitinophagaceae bacterium]
MSEPVKITAFLWHAMEIVDAVVNATESGKSKRSRQLSSIAALATE